MKIQFMEVVAMVHFLVVELILEFMINQIKITVHMHILDIHIFIQIMLIILYKHGKNFQEQNKVLNLKQNNIKYIKLHSND
jgi:hypothetical protein